MPSLQGLLDQIITPQLNICNEAESTKPGTRTSRNFHCGVIMTPSSVEGTCTADPSSSAQTITLAYSSITLASIS